MDTIEERINQSDSLMSSSQPMGLVCDMVMDEDGGHSLGPMQISIVLGMQITARELIRARLLSTLSTAVHCNGLLTNQMLPLGGLHQ